jgi:hypothetical protein
MRKFIINKITKLAMISFPIEADVSISDDGLFCYEFTDENMTSADFEIVEALEPVVFVGHAMAYDSGWSIVNQELYDLYSESAVESLQSFDDRVLMAQSEKKPAIKEEQFLIEVAQIKAGYTEDEIKSWDKQEAEARAWFADNTAPTPLLDGIVFESGEAKEALVANIIAKADAYAAAFGKALGRKRKI